MRDIKFRGKRIDNGEWVYGYYMYNHIKDIYNIYFTEEDPTNIAYGLLRSYEVLSESFGQCIGLHDNNEVDIYDGDMIKHQNYEEILEVRWDNSSCSFKLISINGGQSNFSNELSNMLEIIGNITDNPELLEKK